MPFKDLLVHLDNSAHSGTRLELAVSLARRFGGHLTGLYVKPPTGVSPFLSDQFAPEVMDELDAKVAQQRDMAEALFKESTKRGLPNAEWLEGSADDAAPIIAARARHADLTILGQVDPDETKQREEYQLPEGVVMGAGRPVLMVPYAGAFPTVGERVLVAWNGSAQAARAVGDAMPFLAQAKRVLVLTIGDDNRNVGSGAAGAAGIVQYLARHGIDAAQRHVPGRGLNVGEIILSSAAEDSADLIVMGVYGHSRMRELVMGGVSERLLAEMTMPVLMSH